jgi:hypothetical protein
MFIKYTGYELYVVKFSDVNKKTGKIKQIKCAPCTADHKHLRPLCHLHLASARSTTHCIYLDIPRVPWEGPSVWNTQPNKYLGTKKAAWVNQLRFWIEFPRAYVLALVSFTFLPLFQRTNSYFKLVICRGREDELKPMEAPLGSSLLLTFRILTREKKPQSLFVPVASRGTRCSKHV